MRRLFVGMGANLGDRHQTFRDALLLLSQQIGPLTAVSRVHETEPLVLPGRETKEVPAYLNAALSLETSLENEEILSGLLSIEFQLGRDRSKEHERWMSRVIDLDLLGVEADTHESSSLILPHKEMHKRDFVLVPLAEIAPDWVHPTIGATVVKMLSDLRKS